MNLENNFKRLENLDKDGLIQNFVAQADARYILFNTAENKENFPNYTIDDSKLNILALYYLDIGCVFAENQNSEHSKEPLEKGALILESIHASKENRTKLSDYYILISSLAYYVSYQYSKSFILIQKAQSKTKIAKLISLFLQRRFVDLNDELAELILSSEYKDDQIAEIKKDKDATSKIYTIEIARSLNGFIKYFQTGNITSLNKAKSNLLLLKEIAELRSEPSIWWVIRLLLLVADGFKEAALWSSLGDFFDIKSPTLKKYVRSLVYLPPRGVYELFITQRKSLTKVLNNNNIGCIVTIPTSSGKTRIAEIAIMDCYIKNPENKILYIAPFRSLAFEVENSLEKVLCNIGVEVSHLYGGSLYSKLDEKIIEESNVIIATPEKAKAILRGNLEIARQLKLVIIDEGHLLGPEERLIVNEIFYEELRYIVENNNGRFLVLSAVLPNAEDLAIWLTKSDQTIYKDSWRPSSERLGILEWTGDRVNLNWLNKDTERPSYNNKFILCEAQPLKPREKKQKFFPANKNEAIGCTAYKLKNFGTVLIFVGKKASVFTMAEAYSKSLIRDSHNFVWSNKYDWSAFELACTEIYGKDSKWLLYAKMGIVCHHGGLHADVRLPLERLMRNDKPLVVISTSTLGQGVNLGVSTIIFSTLNQNRKEISSRDFWNIAGRAGRAFIDHEAKILVAHDKSDISTFSAKRKVKTEYELILDYFDKNKIDKASSGILALIKALKKFSDEANIDFDFVLQLISENRVSEIADNAKEIDNILDWIDDSLLSLHDLNNPIGEPDYQWIENFFINSLAYIQIKETRLFQKQDFISFITARVKGIVKKIGDDKQVWKTLTISSIPLKSDLYLEQALSNIIDILSDYNGNEKNIDVKIEITNKIVDLIKDIPVLKEHSNELSSESFSEIIKLWLKAEPFADINKFENAENIITKIFTYKLPWILSGLSKKLRNNQLDEYADLIDEISILIELGLQNLVSVKIYQAGIRSRVCSNELAKLFDYDNSNRTSKDYKKEIILQRDYYKSLVSESCRKWIDLLFNITNSRIRIIKTIPDFNLLNAHKKSKTLIAKIINGQQHLVSQSLNYIEDVSDLGIDFTAVNNIPGIIFKYNSKKHKWRMLVKNPYIEVR